MQTQADYAGLIDHADVCATCHTGYKSDSPRLCKIRTQPGSKNPLRLSCASRLPENVVDLLVDERSIMSDEDGD